MSQIRAIYQGHVPNFPATDQHPGAVRYFVGGDSDVVHDSAAWSALVAAADVAAKDAVYGSHDDAVIAEKTDSEQRGALKAKLSDEMTQRAPALRYAVDAIGGTPTITEIESVLNPPPVAP